MNRRLIQRAAAGAAALMLLSACSSSTKTNNAASSTSVATTTSTVPCSGEPVKLMSIQSVTGALSAPELAAGVEAAGKAINAGCTAGRPITMTVCDDGGDANKAQDCARKAVSEKYLALVGSASAVTDGAYAITSAAGIPTFGNPGGSIGELTSPLSFPIGSGVVVALCNVATIASAGGKTMTLVGPDIPSIALLGKLVTGAAGKLGVTVKKTVLIPVDATDYAQYAAQAEGTDGIAIIAAGPQTKALLQALIDAGTDFKKTIISLPPTITQKDISSFNGKADGVYVEYNAVPLSSTTNKGVAQYLAEMKAAGKADLAIGAGSLIAWRAVHLMAEEIIPKLTTVDSASVLAFLKTAKLDPGDVPPMDYTKPAFPDDPALSKLRIFTTKYVPARVVNGKIVAAADSFVSADQKFTLTK
jgi:ABC-type branched-subunit amino acid transport system substrate-binding protein